MRQRVLHLMASGVPLNQIISDLERINRLPKRRIHAEVSEARRTAPQEVTKSRIEVIDLLMPPRADKTHAMENGHLSPSYISHAYNTPSPISHHTCRLGFTYPPPTASLSPHPTYRPQENTKKGHPTLSSLGSRK